MLFALVSEVSFVETELFYIMKYITYNPHICPALDTEQNIIINLANYWVAQGCLNFISRLFYFLSNFLNLK